MRRGSVLRDRADCHLPLPQDTEQAGDRWDDSPSDPTDDALLTRLLALNQERSL